MSIGPDIKEVLSEMGVRFTINRADGTVITGERLDYETNTQVTKPFIREFFVTAYVAYDSQVQAGDYLVLQVDGRRFVVMNCTPEIFEDAPIKFDVVMYKCNHAVQIMRRSEATTWDTNYDRVQSWAQVHPAVWCLLTEAMFGSALMDAGRDLPLYEMGITKNQMFAPSYYDIKPLDRVIISPTEKYKVEFVEKRKFDNVSIIYLNEDERG